MDKELQKIISEFENLFNNHKIFDKRKINYTTSDFDDPIDNIIKDENLKTLLFKLDEWIIKQKQ